MPGEKGTRRLFFLERNELKSSAVRNLKDGRLCFDPGNIMSEGGFVDKSVIKGIIISELYYYYDMR